MPKTSQLNPKQRLMSMKSSKVIFRSITGLALVLGLCTKPLLAEPAEERVKTYKLESLEVVGSSRLSPEQIREQLRISNNTTLSDEWLAEARTKLMGLAVYKYVFFSLKKGSNSDYAKLIITAYDDDEVLSEWATGGEFGLSLVKPAPDLGDDSPVRSYRFGLVARNIMKRSHRGALIADLGTNGNLIFGSLAYGLPRFVTEAIQFDAALVLTDPSQRYLETEAFGMKGQTLWTRQRWGLDVTYGLAWYSNRHDRYSLDHWPSLVSGPKFGVVRETRLLSFLPKPGYKAAAFLVPSLVNREHGTLEAEVLRTEQIRDMLAVTAAGKIVQIGRGATTLRGDLKLELPITTSSHGLRSVLYFARRIARDQFQSFKHSGSETIAGYRYHSTGFIGDINFKLASENPFAKRWKTPENSELEARSAEIGDIP